MSLYWYACISINTYCYTIYHILLETDWWALSNASSIVRIRSAVPEILADKAFTATDVLISQSFVVTFVHPAYVRIDLIWGFPAQLSLWKSVYWLWRYKLNKVCDSNWLLMLTHLPCMAWLGLLLYLPPFLPSCLHFPCIDLVSLECVHSCICCLILCMCPIH